MEVSRRLICALALYAPVSGPQLRRLVEALGPEENDKWWSGGRVLDGPANGLGLSKRKRQKIYEVLARDPKDVAKTVGRWPGTIVLYGEEDYPARLCDLDEPPAALHVLGSTAALSYPGIAVVGSRKIGVAAGRSARSIMEPVLRGGPSLISGGALGSDALAHRCAVDVGALTVSVLPCGVSEPSPKRNARLFEEIVNSGGVLVSEYPPDQKVRKYHFRRRNRLIAALSRGVFVLRAGEKSGTMLTVEAARVLERPLAAMPGAPDEPHVGGCHDILRGGGAIIANASDLARWWREIGPECCHDNEQREIGQAIGEPNLPECEILQAAVELADEGRAFSIEGLTRATGRSASALQSVLLRHELAGVIEKVSGADRYRIR